MSTGNFIFKNSLIRFDINQAQISGGGGIESPFLLVALSIDFEQIVEYNSNSKNSYNVLSLKSELKATDRNFKISETINLLNYSVERNGAKYGMGIKFPLNSANITQLEANRKGSLPIDITFELQIAYWEVIYAQNNESRVFPKKVITEFDVSSGTCQFTIEQSQWVNKILPAIGHNSYKLIELPIAAKILPDEYKKSMHEFDEARRYFIQGDYDKTVGHCRSALDPFSGKVNLPKLKEYIKSRSEYEWATGVAEATEIWLDKLIKATHGFTSKTHHIPSTGHFDRAEAEIVLLITTGIIAYIGKIEYKTQ